MSGGGDLPAPPAARHFLVAGETHCTAAATVITTVLGSCVAVCLWDRVRQAGGMNHYLLPRGEKPSARFGDVAIPQLLDGMLALGCRRHTLAAKVFGGATSFAVDVGGHCVGQQNVALALLMLEEYDIPVLAHRWGGAHGMLVHLYTATGDVLVRSLGSR